MGVFRSVVLYRTDSNQVVAVSEMDTSHLLNAINHHRKQVDTITFLKDEFNFTGTRARNLDKRREDLIHTIEVLAKELAKRDPQDDEERFPDDDEGCY